MIRTLTLAVLLALAACSRQESAPAPLPAPASAPAPAPAGGASGASPAAAPAATAQSETQQATSSQESGDGEAERPAKSDASLEQMAALPANEQLPNGPWQPGVNYDPIVPAQPTSVAPGKVEVLEVFWLACPHCYALEPHIRSWLKAKPSYVEFVRVPVIWGPMHRAHARLYYTLEALGRQDLIAKAFDTIHDLAERQQPALAGGTDEETLRLQQGFATQNGVGADDFAKAYNSFSVNSDLQRAEQLTQRYHVEGVPFIVVNGKYSTDIYKAGGEGKLIELINWLAAAEHRH
jgi:thiol:disulfide interchange protein DsbA